MILAERYELVRAIGRGGMGQVWEGRDTVLGRRVAVKTVALGPAAEATLADRFRREAVATAALSHPDIVTVYDTGTDGSTAYLVMEYLPGHDLGHLLGTRGPLPLAEALRIGQHVAGALAAAHAIGVVHRDVKPANVLVDGERVTVVDFGIAALTSSSDPALTAPGTTLGTAAYMSPEQATASGVTPAADVYSLGCLLTALVTGRPPFEGEHTVATLRQHLDEPPPALVERRPGVPAELDRLVASMLAKDPRDRPAAADVASSLARLGGVAGGVAAVGPDSAPTTALPAASPTAALAAASPPAALAAASPTAALAASSPPAALPAASPPAAGLTPVAVRADGARVRRARRKVLPVALVLVAVGSAVVVGFGLGRQGEAAAPEAVPAAASASPTPVPTTPAPSPVASETPVAAPAAGADSGVLSVAGALDGLRVVIEDLDADTDGQAAVREDLLARWSDLAEAVDADRQGRVRAELRGLSRRVESLARDDRLAPFDALVLTGALRAVAAGVDAAAGSDRGAGDGGGDGGGRNGSDGDDD